MLLLKAHYSHSHLLKYTSIFRCSFKLAIHGIGTPYMKDLPAQLHSSGRVEDNSTIVQYTHSDLPEIQLYRQVCQVDHNVN